MKKLIILITLILPVICYGAEGDTASVSGVAIGSVSTINATATASIASVCGKNYTDGDGGSTPTYVNGTYGVAESSSTVATSALNSTTSNTIIVCVFNYLSPANRTVSSITDTASNTYARCGSATSYNSVFGMEIWYAKNITGNASNTITATLSGAADYARIHAVQFSGLSTTAPCDADYDPAIAADGTSPATTTADTTAADNSIIVGFFAEGSGGTVDYGNSSPNTVRTEDGSAVLGGAIATRDAATAGSFSSEVTFSGTTSTVCGIGRAFKP